MPDQPTPSEELARLREKIRRQRCEIKNRLIEISNLEGFKRNVTQLVAMSCPEEFKRSPIGGINWLRYEIDRLRAEKIRLCEIFGIENTEDPIPEAESIERIWSSYPQRVREFEGRATKAEGLRDELLAALTKAAEFYDAVVSGDVCDTPPSWLRKQLHAAIAKAKDEGAATPEQEKG